MKCVRRSIYLGLSILFSSCYGVNEKNSSIFKLSICCSSKAWIKIYEEYKIVNGKDLVILNKFKTQPFPNHVLYFKEFPEEYIAISENHEFIRYVYNKKISNEIIDGFSPELKDSERIRIGLRVSSLLMSNLSEEGRRESIILISNECHNYLKK